MIRTAGEGMREGEAIGLDRGDVDLDAGYLTIRDAKFNKSRQVPLQLTWGTRIPRRHIGTRNPYQN
jgi:integrase